MLKFHSLDGNIFLFYANGINVLIMSHICMHLLTRLIFYLVQKFFVFNLLNFRYFNEKLTGEKRIKEPNSGGMAQEKKPAGREREGKKRRTAAQVQFRYAMPNKVFF